MDYEQNRISSPFGAGDGAMIAACLFWALGTVTSKSAFSGTSGGFGVFTFTAFRFWIAALTLFTTLSLSGKPVRVARRDLAGIAAASFFGLFLFMATFNAGLALTPASHAGMLMALIPLFITAATYVTLRRRPSSQLIIGLIMGCVGVFIIGIGSALPVLDRGVVLILISAAARSVYAVYGESFTRVYPPLTATAWTFLFCALYFTPFLIAELPCQRWGEITPEGWENLLVASIVSLAGANTLYYSAIQRIGPARSGIYIYLEPVFTIMLAAVILNEQIELAQYLGFSFIVGGVLLSKTAPRPQTAETQKTP